MQASLGSRLVGKAPMTVRSMQSNLEKGAVKRQWLWTMPATWAVYSVAPKKMEMKM